MRVLVLIVFLSVFFLPDVSTEAQQSKRLYRVGFLSPSTSLQASDEAFRQGLRDLGYVEGQNLVLEWRFTKGDARQFPRLAAELVQLNVDCIVTRGIPAVRSAKQASRTIPIVMNVNDDPVQMRLIASLARPGENVTGFTALGSELAGKRLELLKDVLPKVSRVGHLWGSMTGAAHLREIEAPARSLRIQLQSLEVKGPGDLEGAFRTAGKDTDALIVVAAGWINSHRPRIIDLAVKARLPAMYTQSQFVFEGGLLSYAADNIEQHRRAAVYVDRILKGAKPADMPVEQPTKFELVINLNAAKQIGLKLPPNVLARADRVIR